MALVLRNVKGSRLTFTELDGNFTYLEGLDLSGVTYNIGSQLLTLTRNNGGTLTTTIPTGGGSFTGNTSGSCITDLWVTNIHGCSPVTIGTSIQSPTSIVSGDYSVAYGQSTLATGATSHAEGSYSEAHGDSTHAEGRTSKAYGDFSHAEGRQTISSGETSHAEGHQSQSIGNTSHAEGYDTRAIGDHSHAEGYGTSATGDTSHAEGRASNAHGDYSHAEGYGTYASGEYSHAEGSESRAWGRYSHAEGRGSRAEGDYSHAESQSWAPGYAAHSEGDSNAYGLKSHAEGNSTYAYGIAAHSQGWNTTAAGDGSHAGGKGIGTPTGHIVASGVTSFAHQGYYQYQLGALPHMGVWADFSVILGGYNHNVWYGAASSGIFVGTGNTINTNVERSVILGGANITGTTNDTVYVPHLNIDSTPSNDNALTQILARDTDGSVKYRDASSLGGGGGGTFTGNTSGTCISELWVSNIHSCSPLNINPGDEGNVYFGSSSGVTINVADERIGIGTAGSTNYKLWIKEATTHAQGKIESDNSYARWIIDSHDTNDSILQFNEAGTRRWQIAVDGTDDYMKFTRGDITVGGYTTALVIDTSDNVGIGLDPSHKLDVKIDEESTGSTATTILNLTHDVGADLDSQKLLIAFNLDDANNNGIPQVKIGAEVGENTGAGTELKEGSGAFVIYTASGNSTTTNVISEKMRVDYAGNVGIGTGNPDEKLDVSGKTKTINFQMTSGATDGYVLTSDVSGNGSWQSNSHIEELNDLIDADTANSSVVLANQGAGIKATVGTGVGNFVAISGALSGTTGNDNIVIGRNAATNKIGAADNIVMGLSALGSSSSSSPTKNIMIGYRTGFNLYDNTENIMIGYQAGDSTTANDYSTIVGSYAGLYQYGDHQTIIGYRAGQDDTGFAGFTSSCTLLGSHAGHNVVGTANIAIGYESGYNGSVVTQYIGSHNILLGNGVVLNASGTTRQLVVGGLDRYLLSGDFATTDRTKLGVNISNDIPTANLQVKGHASDTTTLLVEDGSGTDLFTITNTGDTKVLQGDFYVTQLPSVTTVGTDAFGKLIISPSDRRLKKNILNLQYLNPLDFIKSLKGYEFEWREESNIDLVAGRKHYGFLADEVKNIQINSATNVDHQHYMEKDGNVHSGNSSFTNRVGVGNHMVKNTPTKFKHRDSQTIAESVEYVDYIDMIPWLVEGIKELSTDVDNFGGSFGSDKFLQSGIYDSNTQEIVLTLNDNTIIRFPVTDLVDNVNNYVLTGSSTNNILTLTRKDLPDVVIPIDGLQGAKGDTGNTGADGATGAAGENGSDGADGAQGIQGVKGNTGNTGATGAAGADGVDGTNGVDGSPGVKGDAGNTGATGAPGADGAPGTQGAAGTNGTDGADGSDGIQGPAGVPGNSGSNKKYAADISFVADTTKIITHSLNDKDVIVQLKDNAGNLVIPESVNNYQLNTIDIIVSISGTYRVIILG